MNSTKPSVLFYGNRSNPYGVAFGEWVTQWWEWLISIPRSRNPALDTTGEFCGVSQTNPDVWFLAGTFGGSVIRNCEIPYGKAILFPIINCEFSFADDPSMKTEKELEERCRVEMDRIGDVYASLDGEPIDVRKYRLHSPCFTVNLPVDNCLGGLVGETRLASDGYWLYIKPLPRGDHVLTSFGSCLAGKIKIGCTFNFHVK